MGVHAWMVTVGILQQDEQMERSLDALYEILNPLRGWHRAENLGERRGVDKAVRTRRRIRAARCAELLRLEQVELSAERLGRCCCRRTR